MEKMLACRLLSLLTLRCKFLPTAAIRIPNVCLSLSPNEASNPDEGAIEKERSQVDTQRKILKGYSHIDTAHRFSYRILSPVSSVSRRTPKLRPDTHIRIDAASLPRREIRAGSSPERC